MVNPFDALPEPEKVAEVLGNIDATEEHGEGWLLRFIEAISPRALAALEGVLLEVYTRRGIDVRQRLEQMYLLWVMDSILVRAEVITTTELLAMLEGIVEKAEEGKEGGDNNVN